MEPARVASFIGIMLNICELFTNFADEVDFLWAKLDQMTLSKWYYLYSRYFVFVVHLQHYHYAPQYQRLDRTRPAPPGMSSWMLYKFFFYQTLVYGIDFVLCKRAHFLYKKSTSTLYFLYSIQIFRTLLVAISCYITRITLQICTPTGRDSLTFRAAGYYICGEIFMQIVLVALAFSGVIRKGPLHMVNFLAEAGTESCICVIVLILGLFIYSFGYQISVFVYPSGTGILSAICCRLILSNHRNQRIR